MRPASPLLGATVHARRVRQRMKTLEPVESAFERAALQRHVQEAVHVAGPHLDVEACALVQSQPGKHGVECDLE